MSNITAPVSDPIPRRLSENEPLPPTNNNPLNTELEKLPKTYVEGKLKRFLY